VSAFSRSAEYQIDDDGNGSENSNRLVSVGPALKVYGGLGGAFLPYGYASLFAQFGSSKNGLLDQDNEERDHRALGAQLGLGVDWFPVSRVSIGGHVGVEALTGENEPGPDIDEEFTSFNTINSGIRVQFYF
jgi:hypothetical protein